VITTPRNYGYTVVNVSFILGQSQVVTVCYIPTIFYVTLTLKKASSHEIRFDPKASEVNIDLRKSH